MPHHNSRRRFLAFMGLIGVPAAIWSPARAQADADADASVTCTVDEGAYDYFMHYDQDFDVSGGTLQPTLGDSLIAVDARPTKVSFIPPYGAAKSGTPEYTDPITGMGGFDGTDGSFSLSMNGTITPPSFKAYVYVPDDGKPHVYQAQLAIAGSPDALAMADATARTLGGSQQDLTGEFSPDLMPTLRSAAFDLTVIIDGKAMGSYRYDFTQIPWQTFQKERDDYYAQATGVTVDAEGNANLDECAGSECFFTTAASHTLGLSDDCWELRMLRRFRDGTLARTPEGRALTARYYAEAPRLVAAVNARADAARVWLGAYWSHIVPCAVMAGLGCDRLAVTHYRDLFTRLERLAAA